MGLCCSGPTSSFAAQGRRVRNPNARALLEVGCLLRRQTQLLEDLLLGPASFPALSCTLCCGFVLSPGSALLLGPVPQKAASVPQHEPSELCAALCSRRASPWAFGSSSPEHPAAALHSLCVLTAALTLTETVILFLTRSLYSFLYLRAWLKVPLDIRIPRYSSP